MRHLRKSSIRTSLLLCTLVLLLCVSLSFCLGAVALSPMELLRAFSQPESTAAKILLHVRLPRTLATLLAGSALSVAGVVIQGVLHNPLAGPNIIGVNAGAGFGVVLCLALLPKSPQLLPFAAFLGALGAVFLVYGVAKKTGASRMTLVLSGVAVGAILNALIDGVCTLVPDVLSGSNAFRIGGVAGVSLRALSPVWWVIALCLAAVFLLHHELDILALGDEMAQSLGLKVRVLRPLLLALAAALAGGAVSFAGLLGFVGLLVPHVGRMLVGEESGRLLPIAALLGASFLTICDVLSRCLFAPFELPVGILLSLLGGPFFLFLLIRGRNHA